MDTTLDLPLTLAEKIEQYHRCLEQTRQAYADLKDSENRLNAIFGSTYRSFSVMPRGTYPTTDDLPQVEKELEKKVWALLIEQTGIHKILSDKAKEQMDKDIDEGKLPPVSYENITRFCVSLNDNALDFAKESIVEVWQYLRPANTEWGAGKYKTNNKNARFDLGEKVIITCAVESTWSLDGYTVKYWNKQKLIGVDRVFHLLDGAEWAGTNAYYSPLIDAIQSSTGEGETPYFKFKCYGNGNLHLTFLRPDLVTKFNRVCGNATQLKGL